MPRMRSLALPAALALATSAAARFAMASPIDCSKAATRNERTLCGDPFLLQTDARLDTLYDISQRLVAPGERDALVTSQRAWVKEREACGTDKNCMRAAYAKRASTFEGILKRAESHGPF